MSRHALWLDGWEHQSVWGWDPVLEVWWAQLWANDLPPDDLEKPTLWLGPPAYAISTRQELAAHIAAFLGIDVETVIQVFAESYKPPWRAGNTENDWEPEPPLRQRRWRVFIRRCIRKLRGSGRSPRNTAPVARSLPPRAPGVPTVDANVIVLPERCYRCGTSIASIVGVLVPKHLSLDGSGFVEFEIVAKALVPLLPDEVLAPHGVGPLRRRASSIRTEPYWSNGCVACGAIQGNFPLQEALMEFLVEGGSYEGLPTIANVALPVAAITVDDDWE